MAKLFIYRGLPGSGKTTSAKVNAQLDGGRVVGRDHFRAMMGIDSVGTLQQEQEITDLQEQMIGTALRLNQNVHVDDMNLRVKYVSRLIGIAHHYGVEYQIIDLTNVDLHVCHIRNLKRDRVVPSDVIDDLHKRFIAGRSYPLPVPVNDTFQDILVGEPYKPIKCAPSVYLVDIDGTVAIHEGIRGHYDYDQVHLDIPNYDVIEVVNRLSESGATLIFISGRPDSCFDETYDWLLRYVDPNILMKNLLMRKTGDGRADYKIKLDIFNEHIRNRYLVMGAFDDRNQVVEMYRKLGITVFQVADGNF